MSAPMIGRRRSTPPRMLLLFGAFAWLIAQGPTASADEPSPPPLPDSTIALIHIRAADIWRSESMKEVRTLLMRVDPKFLRALDERFVPAPSSIDRLTMVVVAPEGGRGEPQFGFYLTTSAPFDPNQWAQRSIPDAQEERTENGAMRFDAKLGLAFHVVNQRTLLFGSASAVRALQKSGRAGGPLNDVISKATPAAPIVLGANLAAIPDLPREHVPPPLVGLLDAKLLTATLEIGKEPRLHLNLEFPDANKAAAGEQSARAAIDMARQGLASVRPQLEAAVLGNGKEKPGALAELPEAIGGVFGLAMLQSCDDLLKDFPLQRQGANLSAAVQLPGGFGITNPAFAGVAVGLLLPAVQKVREAATRMQDANNLKQIAIAMHNYHSVNAHFPPAAICDKAGKPLLSWRVAILPYLEQENLYKQFKLDEPWDSPNNKKLLPLMPKAYALPVATGPGDANTYYRVFVGPQAPFEMNKGRSLADFTDGTSNTWLVVESAQPVPWTKPDELIYDPAKPVPELGSFFSQGFNVAYADGSVRFFPQSNPESLRRAFITHAGGEVINDK